LKGFSGSPLRPKKYGCQGATLVMAGTPLASAWSATGLVVSGVPVARIRSTSEPVIRSPATVAARLGSDWLSLTRISTAWAVPPIWRPSLSAVRTPSRMKVSASPKPASGPVWGLT
jgi:hypothetical protein